MKSDRFEDSEAWQLARKLSLDVYELTRKPRFDRDFGLQRQIQGASGEAMHSIAGGLGSDRNNDSLRSLRYAKRSCAEVQSQLYVALDENYVTKGAFEEVYGHAEKTRATIDDLIKLISEREATRQADRRSRFTQRETANSNW